MPGKMSGRRSQMKVRELIAELIKHDLDAVISIDADVLDEIEDGDGLELKEVKYHDSGFGKWSVFVLEIDRG